MSTHVRKRDYLNLLWQGAKILFALYLLVAIVKSLMMA